MPKSMTQFLRENRFDPHWRGGVVCSICKHKQAKAVDADLREFAAAKRAGHVMPWAVFQRKRLAPLYEIRIGVNAILKHVRKCLGVEGV